MPNCLNCGKKFHACSSCGLNYAYEYKYCNDTCWKKSDEYNIDKKICCDFFKSLSKEQKDIFIYIIEDISDDYEFEINNWLKEENHE